MKKYLLLIVTTLAMIGIRSPASAIEYPANYLMVKGGIYSPSESHDIRDFNGGGSLSHMDSKNGFNGELAVGHYFLPVFAAELGVGYFESKGSPAAEPGKTRLKVVPVVATAKALLPLGVVEPYGEFGIGAYFTEFDVEGNLGNFSGSSEVTYGLHAGAGVNFNLSETVFLGVGGRYLWAKPSFGGQDITLDGFTTTANLGLRF
jgi:opacity protein-like surface antigen